MKLKMLIRIGLLALFFCPFLTSLADWPQEERRIDFLLNEIRQLDAVFIRNNSTHSPSEAVSHLQMKLNRAQNSWFAPVKEKWTAELFIEKIASKSSLSGKPYLIKFKDGRVVAAGDWLKEKLNRYEN